MRNLCVRASRLVISVVFLLLSAPLGGFASSSEITGRVLDPSGAVVVEAQVTATNVATNIKRTTTTNEQGVYRFLHLAPGEYNLRVSHAGFRATDVLGIVVHVTQTADVNVTLRLGSVVQTVTVEGGRIFLGTQGPEVGTVIDRRFVENLPLNGRSFHTLIELTPGVLPTRTTGSEQGQFSVNGQRANANYFMVDGVSANIGTSLGNTPGQQAGGTVPALTAFGGTNNLVSIDAMEEFRIQTSTYAPEFGRMPGAQISILTRSGTNEFHGTLFDYFRNDKLDANDWFANRSGLEKAALRQNNFGGVIGGPILKDRTFFFFSYEGLRLRQPQFQINPVPSVNARQIAPPEIKTLLDAFPVPNGADLGNETAEFAGTFSAPSSLNAYSIRVDHSWGKLHVFGRYNDARSGVDERLPNMIQTEVPSRLTTQTFTAGATLAISPNFVNDFRANWSRTRGDSRARIAEIGGNVIPPDSALFPSFTSSEESLFAVIMGAPAPAFLVGKSVNNRQLQINLIDTLSIVRASHHLKFGVDYRWLSPVFDIQSYANVVVFPSVPFALTGTALLVQVLANETGGYTLRFNNLSLYAQDTWRTTPRLTLTYGLRWEYNPPPSEKDGKLPFTVEGLEDPATMTLAPQGTRLWKSTYNNFAPRVGIAYEPSQSRGIVLRGGFGFFYDLGTGQAVNGIAQNAWPYGRIKLMFFTPWPIDAAAAEPPPFSLAPPAGPMNVSDPKLELPYSAQWNVALEKSLGPNQTVSASYVGAVGRRLLRRELLQNPNSDFTQVRVIRSAATSDYGALQIQFQRRLSRGLQALVNYAWSHSIDNISDESSTNVPAELIDLDQERGSSDFDVRHSFTAAVTYDISTPAVADAARVILRNWSIDTIVRARSATPINVLTGTDVLGLGLTNVFRPDLVPGAPIWIDDPSVGGGRRLNPAAFAIPVGRQGTLGRNALRGFDLFQTDFAIRRQFVLTERLNVQFRADFFNIFNHPNFANPINGLTSALFGESIQMLGQSLGQGGLIGGFSPLYQFGGPRSIQLALKFQF